MLSVSAVPPAEMEFAWAQVEPMVKRGLAHGMGDSTTAEHIKAAIRSGESILWAVHDGPDVIAIVVIEVVRYPAKTTLLAALIAGSHFKEWAPMVQELLRDYADLIGADTIETSVRDGLVKWLAPMGWKRKSTIMSLERERTS